MKRLAHTASAEGLCICVIAAHNEVEKGEYYGSTWFHKCEAYDSYSEPQTDTE